MSYYYGGSGNSYKQYLQTKSFVDDIRWELKESRLKQIATTDELKALRFDVRSGTANVVRGINQTNVALTAINNSITDLHGAMNAGFVTLHSDLQHVSNSIYDLGVLFDWHLDRVVTRLGSLGDNLQELIKISASPEQTWAYEQYESARLAYRRQLYEEAFTFLDRAINGYGNHTGYMLEHRFHHLLGDLYFKHGPGLGDTADLEKAEAAYLKSARYAMADNRDNAALSLAGAAYVAYCDHRCESALVHIGKAVELAPDVAEYHFQFAKYQFALGNSESGLGALRRSILHDGLYSIKWQIDGDFAAHAAPIAEMIESWRLSLLGPMDVIRPFCHEFRSRSSTATHVIFLFSKKAGHGVSIKLNERFRTRIAKHQQLLDGSRMPTFIGAAQLIGIAVDLMAYDDGFSPAITDLNESIEEVKRRSRGWFGSLSEGDSSIVAYRERDKADIEKLQSMASQIPLPLPEVPRFPTAGVAETASH